MPTTKSVPRRANVRDHGTGTEVQVQSDPTQPSLGAQVSRRHYGDHPMRGLTDDELRALMILGDYAGLFRAELQATLEVLSLLASHEDGDRQLAIDLAKGQTDA